MPAPTMPFAYYDLARRRPGDIAVTNDSPQAEEWVHAALIEDLVAVGWPTTSIHYECWLAPNGRCDVVVIEPDRVAVFECKVEDRMIGPGAVRQTRRYAEAAAALWPDRDIYAFLVWPSTYPVGPVPVSSLRVLAVA